MTTTPLKQQIVLRTPGDESPDSFPHFVSALPVRRRISTSHMELNQQVPKTHVEIKESLILRHELATPPGSVLLRVKHVAVDFSTDFSGAPSTVPGRITIGRVHNSSVDKIWSPSNKFLVFPYSRCLHEAEKNGKVHESVHATKIGMAESGNSWGKGLCINCKRIEQMPLSERDSYEVHRRWPCVMNPTFGKDLAGGFQDYMQVRSPQNSLVKLSEHISVHDCCFLLDIALPFYSFCEDTLSEVLATSPNGRVLILLNDCAKEANDCLLVIHHLKLDHSRFTFTDVVALQESPDLLGKYSNKFNHVLVFARSVNAFKLGVQCGVSSGLPLNRTRYTLTMFCKTVMPSTCQQDHPDKYISQVSLSYKDKYLLKKLLETIGALNTGHDQSEMSTDSGISETSVPSEKNPMIPAVPSKSVSPTIPMKSGNPFLPSKSENPFLPSNQVNSSIPSSSEKLSIPSIPSKSGIPSKLGIPSKSGNLANVNPLNAKSNKPQLQNQSQKSRYKKDESLSRRNLRWLHCDRDFGLCSNYQVFDEPADCHSSETINAMLRTGCKFHRVFYTNRPQHLPSLNALVLSSTHPEKYGLAHSW